MKIIAFNIRPLLFALALLASLVAPCFAQSSKTRVAVLVYPGVELLDFSGPVEVFSNVSDFEVYLVGKDDSMITTKNNTLRFTPHYNFNNAPQPDILVVPGGPMQPVLEAYQSTQTLAWIKKMDRNTKITMSVCTGAFILSKAGLTQSKRITSHSAVVDSLARFAPTSQITRGTRFEEDGKLVTTAGISAGIDGALHVVERLRGKEQALLVTRIMEYTK